MAPSIRASLLDFFASGSSFRFATGNLTSLQVAAVSA
jgi:hypothetical protein